MSAPPARGEHDVVAQVLAGAGGAERAVQAERHAPSGAIGEDVRDDEGRAFLQRGGFPSAYVCLHALVNESADAAIRRLCVEINATKTLFPGTDLRLIYEGVIAESLRSGGLQVEP